MSASAVNRDRALGELATELRTVITPVLGYLELLDEIATPGPIAEEQLRWVETIHGRLVSLGALTDEMFVACARLRELGASAPSPQADKS